jgi:outer membrane lipoprotein-sorting protein
MRTEAEITDKRTGKTTNQILIMTEKYVFFFDIEKKSGMRISADSPSSPESAMKQSAESRKTAKYIGKGAVDGVSCGMYSYSFVPEGEDEGTLMKYTEWRNGDGFAVKTVNEVKNAKTTTVISNLKKNPVLSDPLFEPGPDINIVDMDDMTKRASGIRVK